MPILVRCMCGKNLSAPSKLAGKQVACPSCQSLVQIPAEGAAAGQPAMPTTSASNAFIISCVCGQQFTATPEMAGMQSSCPTCGSFISVPGGAAPSQPFAAQPFAAPQPPTDEYRLQGNYPQQPYGTQSPFGAPAAGAWNTQGYPPPANDPLAAGAFSSAYDQRNITLPPMPGQASFGQPSSHTLGAASTTLPNAYVPSSSAYPAPPKASSEGWGQIGGGIALMILAVAWFCGGLFFDIIFFYPPILFIIGLIMFVKGIIAKVS